MSDLLAMALAYRAAGLSVIPLGRDKRPYWQRLPQLPDPRRPGRTKGVWQPFRQQAADASQLHAWFGDGQANVGLVGGRVSGGLVVLDFDHEAAAIFPAWLSGWGSGRQLADISDEQRLPRLFAHRTNPIGNRTLAWSCDGRKRIETRGEGGYITAPPSRHASGHIYCWLWGDATAVPVLSAAAVTAVLAAAHFNARPKPNATNAAFRRNGRFPPQGDAFIRLQRYAHAALHHEVTALGQRHAARRPQ
ncbi:MAG: bifunctional DNA primase/polymerase [Chloroflexi bacterium]|nr:bifunctional DNA primase/polymerase [Chloroflexota bacterium]